VIEVTAVVADDQRAVIDEVAERLAAAGLRVSLVLPRTGVIAGRVADRDVLAALACVDGVLAIEPARTVTLPPPDSPVQ
jgi:hypothetical protein